MADYTLTVRLDADVDTADERIRAALADEGFGILTEIDIRATLKKKLDVEMDDYRILGACNPPLANDALQADPYVGALLPCNVVVRTHPDGGTEIAAADPEAMLGVADNTALHELACDAKERIQRALTAAAG